MNFQFITKTFTRHEIASFHENSSDNTPYEKVGNNEPVSIADEVPFEIPESWEWVRASNLGQMVRGKGIKRTDTILEGMPCVRYGEIYTTYNTSFTSTKSFIPQQLYNQCNLFHTGDLIFTLTGENKPDIAKAVAYLGESPVAAGGDLAYWTYHRMNPLYLVYFMASPYCIEQKRRLATGDIIVHISTDKVGSFLVPVPPKAEQDRIVAKLQEIEPLLQEYDQKEQKVHLELQLFPEQLKKSILQMAVQGKLVPQDPSDEPASILLERIRAEKERLIREGKIKRDKNESVIFRRDNSHYEKRGKIEACIDEKIPFDIPENWEWMRLSSFGVFSSGKTPSMSDSQNWNGGTIPWVSSKDMKRRVIEDSEMHITTTAAASMKIYPAGTLLLVARSGILRRLLPLCVLGIDSTINQDIKAFDLYDLSLSDWLFYAIKAFEPMILHDLVKSVTTVESLKFDEFSEMLIPVPPLNEQKRIIGAIHTFTNLVKPLYNDPLFSL